MSNVTKEMPRKSQPKKSQPVQADEGAKKKGDKLTFRLKDKTLARKLNYILLQRDVPAWKFIEPLIRDEVEIAFADVQRDVGRLADGGGGAEGKKAE